MGVHSYLQYGPQIAGAGYHIWDGPLVVGLGSWVLPLGAQILSPAIIHRLFGDLF